MLNTKMSSTFNDTVADCDKATLLFTNTNIRNILISECVFAILAIAPNGFFLSIIRKSIVLPSNLRILLGHLGFIFLWFALGDTVKCVYLLTRDPCAFEISQQDCRIFDLVTTWLVLPNIFYALMPICVERLYATINYRIYDNQSKPWLAYSLILCAWITAICMNGVGVFWLPDDRYVPICDSSFTPPPSNPVTTSVVYLSLETGAIFATVFIYFYNRHVASSMAINRAKYNLSARFMIDQNVQINNVIVPCMVLHLVFHVPAFAFIVAGKSNAFGVGPETGYSLTRFSFLWRMVYALLYPICAIHFNQYLKNYLGKGAIGKFLGRFGIQLQNGVNLESGHAASKSTVHFNYLNEIWSVGKPKNAKMKA